MKFDFVQMTNNNIPLDSLILVLMNTEPKTRTTFLQTTFISGIKTKLRTYAEIMFPIDSTSSTINIIKQLTSLMRFGGVPKKEMIQKITEQLNKSQISHLWNDYLEISTINAFLKIYFDCGFIYDNCLYGLIRKMNQKDFPLYKTIYEEIYKRDKSAQDTFEDLFVESPWTNSKKRQEYFEEWIVNQNISSKQVAEYIWFDYQHHQIDTEAIFIYLRNSISDYSKDYTQYILEVFHLPFDYHDSALNIYMSNFFHSLIQHAVYMNARKERDLVLELEKYSYLMLDYFCKIVKQIEEISNNNDGAKNDKLNWLNDRITNIIVNRPKDINIAYLIKNRPDFLKLLE